MSSSINKRIKLNSSSVDAGQTRLAVSLVLRAGAVSALAEVGALAVARLGISRAFYRVLTLLLLVRLGCPGVAGCVPRGRLLAGCSWGRPLRLPVRGALRPSAKTFQLVDGLRDERVRERHLGGHARVRLPLNAFLTYSKSINQVGRVRDAAVECEFKRAPFFLKLRFSLTSMKSTKSASCVLIISPRFLEPGTRNLPLLLGTMMGL